MPASTMTWKRLEDVLIVAHAAESPTADEWSGFVGELNGSGPALSRMIVFTAGATINAMQRGQVVDAVKKYKLRIGVLTDSTTVRGAVTALEWFGVAITAVAPQRQDDLLRKLEIAPLARDDIKKTIEQLKRRIT
jgi:hypothetical protein